VPDGFQSQNYREIAALAARYRLPAVYSNLALARAGRVAHLQQRRQ